MKEGDRLTIEHVRYEVAWKSRGGRILLKRIAPKVTLARFKALLRARRWRRPSVSANFLIDDRNHDTTIDSNQMLALGIPSKRIEAYHARLPLLTLGPGGSPR